MVFQHSSPAVDKFLTSFVSTRTHTRTHLMGMWSKQEEKQKAEETKEKQQQNLHNNNRREPKESRGDCTFWIDLARPKKIMCQVWYMGMVCSPSPPINGGPNKSNRIEWSRLEWNRIEWNRISTHLIAIVRLGRSLLRPNIVIISIRYFHSANCNGFLRRCFCFLIPLLARSPRHLFLLLYCGFSLRFGSNRLVINYIFF